MTFEDAGVGLQWDNYAEGEFSFGVVLQLLFGDTLLYALLAWYCGNVVPSEYGLRRHPLFFLSGAYWRSVVGGAPGQKKEAAKQLLVSGGGAASSAAAAHTGSADVEQAPEGLEPVLRLAQLRKTFGSNVAVSGLELDAYDSSIFCLLGHNGAGKTTTISMLTGLIPPTSGDATVFGHSIAEDMGSIRRLLGVCPQHDVLFPQLTVRQHLVLFSALKGVPAADVAAEVQAKINLVGLTEKDGTQSRALSGGQRRKLSVAIALLGSSSKAVFLDEPTSGMDPCAWGGARPPACLPARMPACLPEPSTRAPSESQSSACHLDLTLAQTLPCLRHSPMGPRRTPARFAALDVGAAEAVTRGAVNCPHDALHGRG
jgi:ABC-type branched-subunit amino acid transport system ATPase component